MPNQQAQLDAEYLIAVCTLSGLELRERLIELEREARKYRLTTLVENILLELAGLRDQKGKPELADQLKWLDKVLEAKHLGWNQVRAIVTKAEILLSQGGGAALDGHDVAMLGNAYSYLLSQRFSGLFDRCHECLWRVFEGRGNKMVLVELFRYSSFAWRIRGEEKREEEFLRRLAAQGVSEQNVAEDAAGRYFVLRWKARERAKGKVEEKS